MFLLTRIKKFVFLISVSLLVLPGLAYPCTTLFLPQSRDQVVAANMDWSTGTGLMYINKRDVLKTSAFVSPPLTPLQWTSQYMSLTLTPIGLEFPWEGMNEMGVSVTLLSNPNTLLPQGSDAPAVNGLQFVQYLLDTSATTAEAVANTQSVQVAGPFGALVQYVVCDATGACATIENLNHNLVIREGSSLPYMALTNNGYQRSINYLTALLAVYTPSQILALPAEDSLTRFAKAGILSSEYVPQDDELSYAFSALHTVAQDITQWQMAFQLATQTLHWITRSQWSLKSVELSEFNNQCSTGVQVFHVNSPLSGDVGSYFVEYSSTLNNSLVLSSWQSTDIPSKDVPIVEAYPGTTHCTEENATLSSSQNPSSLGQQVVLTAQVNGAGKNVPTGTVTFQYGTTVLGTGTLNAGGMAQLAVSTLPLGMDSLTAAYGGDTHNAPITSPPMIQTVVQYGTQANLASSQNPTTVNSPVTFVATVTGQGGGTPTGTVTFTLNGGPVAVVPLVNGQASYTMQFKSSGQDLMGADYSGDSNYEPVVSSLTETVN
jgi:penicillin V acylase-like amidase (Ntn superfamily)